ncbi:hypothetical protein HNQ77_000509 [Silvibacterium bohemicum]|uniref:Uncharacterized protein n=1 Tax=Silvibacterium bohemicum TaxID=1577686 RepID=A0A841JUA7_9BACT|nr:hypothetical protein [Silvibacterium bohemicum]MBB6142571.1 hypothetical protein [Silvibacterium bohemicum]
MDPILTKAVTPGISDPSAGGLGTQLPKGSASPFDKIKAQLQETADQVNPSSSQAVQPATNPAQSAGSAANSASGVTKPASMQSLPPGPEKLQQSMAVGRYHLDRVQSAVKSNSSASTMDKVKGKLTSIEAQYNQLDVTLQQISPNATPQDWLRLQQMASSMNENIAVLSKLVDSASSGVKTILQTQI